MNQCVIDMEKMVNDVTKPPQNIRQFAAEFVMSARTERSGIVQTPEQFDFLVACLTEFYTNVIGQLKAKADVFDVVSPCLTNTYQKQVPAFLKAIH